MKNGKNTEELLIGEKSYEYLLSQTQDIVFEWDYVTKKIYHSDVFRKKFEVDRINSDFPYAPFTEKIIHPDDLQNFYACYEEYNNGKLSSVGEFRMLSADGEYGWYRSSSTAMTDKNGSIVKVLGILSNIDTQKKETLLAQAMAMRDGLTGLYNRAASEQLIAKYLANSSSCGAMFIIDIDNFKNINDTLGHQFGDKVLISISESLRALFRSNDIVGRLGGDEFIVFMTGLGENYNIKRRARDLVAVIRAPFEGKTSLVEVSASIGIALSPHNGNTFSELYKNADLSLYRSKSYGKNRYTLFDENFTTTNNGETGKLTDIERTHDHFKDEMGIIGASDNIIYISDASNLRIMYLNDAAKKAYNLTDDDLGKKCYQAFHHINKKCETCYSLNLKFDEFKVSEVENLSVGKTFIVREKLISWKGITAQISFATDITKQANEYKEACILDSEKQHLLEAIEKISSATILQDGIDDALQLICKFYNGDGVTYLTQPQAPEPKLKGEFCPPLGSSLPKYSFAYPVSENLLAYIDKAIFAHSGALYLDLSNEKTFIGHDFPDIQAHGVKSILIHSTTLIAPNMIMAIINPKINISYTSLMEKTQHFIESETQKRSFTQQINNEIVRYRTLLNTMSDSMFEYDVAKDELTVHVNGYEKYGMPSSMMVYKEAKKSTPIFFLKNKSIQSCDLANICAAFSGEDKNPTEFKVTRNDGQEVWIQIASTQTCDDFGKPIRVSGVFRNVTEKHFASCEREVKKLKHEIAYNKGHDVLTGLYNKYHFYETIPTILKNNLSTEFVIVKLDISGFKMVNEVFGMEEGDRLLKYLASCLRQILEPAKNVAFARFEADIFYICMPYEKDSLFEYRRLMDNAVATYGIDFDIILSYGIYAVTDRQLPIEIMCDRAAIAQSTIKHSYVQRYATYTSSLKDNLLNEHHLTNDMAASLKNHEFVVFYQPLIDLSTNNVIGAEALVRWVHPQKGMLSPAEFIPVFEKNGFIIKLDAYVWTEVCRQLKNWKENRNVLTPVSVNVSRASMHNPMLCKTLTDICKEFEVPHHMLKLEIMESTYANTSINLGEITKALIKAGFTVMMDDFGSGFSSLNMLKDVPVDVLKVDLNFLSASDSGDKGSKILSSVVRMAKWLNLPVVAEGVETQEQADFLRNAGCNMAQGYYFSRPMPLEQYESFIRNKVDANSKSSPINPFGKLALEILSNPDTWMNFLFATLFQMASVMENIDLTSPLTASVSPQPSPSSIANPTPMTEVIKNAVETFPLAVSRTMIKNETPSLIYANNRFFSMYKYTEQTIHILYDNPPSGDNYDELNKGRQAMLSAISNRLPSASMEGKFLCGDLTVKNICSARLLCYKNDGAVVITCISCEI